MAEITIVHMAEVDVRSTAQRELDKIERAVRRLEAKTNGHDLERIREAITSLIDLGVDASSDIESILGRVLDGE